ncbi:DEAD/DEAH box helicase [Candidatus Uhrbacteria bacterium]|nr:DEAD/DEAH box helicase [Candidatus Uhrbacteria bacterium]
MQALRTDIPSGFAALGIAPGLLEILARLAYTTPTPIQSQAIPVAIQGKDVVGIAQTGTGKTLAFGIPMIQELARVQGTGLILLPTRELALQVDEALRKLGSTIGLKTAVLIGGTGFGAQEQALRRKPHILIATPGRLVDHINQKTCTLHTVRILVIDEADRMLDMGFAPDIERILARVPRERQTMLFSATMPEAIMKIATKHMRLPIRIEIARTGTPAERITQEMFIIRKDQKNRLLDKLLEQHTGTTLIFTRTKYGAKRLAVAIRGMGHSAAEIHSNRSLAQRKEALQGFKSGKYRILVATDIASRGIDVANISLVLNYDLPEASEDYIHRIGRTARAGAGGHAISFVTPEERGDVRAIERLMKKNLPVSATPVLPPARPQTHEQRFVEERSSRRPHHSARDWNAMRQSRGGGPRRRPQRGGFPHRNRR